MMKSISIHYIIWRLQNNPSCTLQSGFFGWSASSERLINLIGISE